MQVHKRLTTEQIKRIFSSYLKHQLTLKDGCRLLSLKRSQFYGLFKKYRTNPQAFTLTYQRRTPKTIPDSTEAKIKGYLEEDHALVANPQVAITTYNYSAIEDRLAQDGLKVSLPTIINRAKQYGYYLPKKRHPADHSHRVITTATGALLQHDSSHHLWSR